MPIRLPTPDMGGGITLPLVDGSAEGGGGGGGGGRKPIGGNGRLAELCGGNMCGKPGGGGGIPGNPPGGMIPGGKNGPAPRGGGVKPGGIIPIFIACWNMAACIGLGGILTGGCGGR